MSDTQYADGVFGKAPNEKAPDFVLGRMSIHADRFAKWLADQSKDDQGYVRLDILRQKKDPSKFSFVLDTYQKQGAQAGADSTPADDSGLPF